MSGGEEQVIFPGVPNSSPRQSTPKWLVVKHTAISGLSQITEEQAIIETGSCVDE